ncbi:hypothetical protein [Pseudomonas protegens]|uniref:hypothetical protein n=1 Tax=Pseudomonas protegens TaxID=380021 RepID=UPI0005A1C2BB|nr:hypothetical protein [Pseudomonas protegens]MBP5113789.1 hypothetical protein [Pseudomonas protegens]MBP5118892.1 hypothetical protein [Pseudomonas protegens]QTU20621.1 hypothetical protein HUT22_21635 [Pseudomonas protegens]QTU23033.1 hypothetical protein HUT21_01310 [Pseudomonas protegens]QTU32565.1 hypothetical protein HUT20_19215 [Pseudomonas protegens]
MTQAITDLAGHNDRVKPAAQQRALAVSAALAVIHAKAANTPADCNIIKDEMSNLGEYADLIQEAMKVK